MTATITTSIALERLAGAVQANVDALASAPPEAATIRPRVRTSLIKGTPTGVHVSTGPHEFTIDEPTSLGGDDTGANPVEHLLASLGACQVISYQVWAAKLGIAIDNVEVDITGDLDVRGFFGLDHDIRPGFNTIQVEARITGPEHRERYEELTDLVERHCPVLDIITVGVPVTSKVTYAD